MSISLRPERLKRYRDVARLLLKYGRADIVSRAWLAFGILRSDRPAKRKR